MDPITLSIIAAVTAGVTAGASKVAEKAIVDAYEGLKDLIKKKFGANSEVIKAIVNLENESDFEPNKTTLQGRITQAKADKDEDVLKSAQKLLDLLQERPNGAQAIQHVQNVYGDYSAAAGPYGTATVNVNQPPKNE